MSYQQFHQPQQMQPQLHIIETVLTQMCQARGDLGAAWYNHFMGSQRIRPVIDFYEMVVRNVRDSPENIAKTIVFGEYANWIMNARYTDPLLRPEVIMATAAEYAGYITAFANRPAQPSYGSGVQNPQGMYPQQLPGGYQPAYGSNANTAPKSSGWGGAAVNSMVNSGSVREVHGYGGGSNIHHNADRAAAVDASNGIYGQKPPGIVSMGVSTTMPWGVTPPSSAFTPQQSFNEVPTNGSTASDSVRNLLNRRVNLVTESLTRGTGNVSYTRRTIKKRSSDMHKQTHAMLNTDAVLTERINSIEGIPVADHFVDVVVDTSEDDDLIDDVVDYEYVDGPGSVINNYIVVEKSEEDTVELYPDVESCAIQLQIDLPDVHEKVGSRDLVIDTFTIGKTIPANGIAESDILRLNNVVSMTDACRTLHRFPKCRATHVLDETLINEFNQQSQLRMGLSPSAHLPPILELDKGFDIESAIGDAFDDSVPTSVDYADECERIATGWAESVSLDTASGTITISKKVAVGTLGLHLGDITKVVGEINKSGMLVTFPRILGNLGGAILSVFDFNPDISYVYLYTDDCKIIEVSQSPNNELLYIRLCNNVYDFYRTSEYYDALNELTE